MAVIPRAGSRTPPPDNQKALVTTDDVLSETTHVKDTFLHRTAIDPSTYASEHKALMGYASGHRVAVRYFHRTDNMIGKQTHTTDVSSVRNPIHQQHILVNNMELTFPEGYQFSYDSQSTESQVTGAALMYAGFSPTKGSVFLMSVADGQTGMFVVSSIERLSLRQGSNHRITFYLKDILTEEVEATLLASVVRTVYFDKATYMGDGLTLLEDDAYRQLMGLRRLRQILVHYYASTFYDDAMSTYMAPSGIYDPYLIQFLLSKVSLSESNRRPMQLYPNPESYAKTIWSRLLEPFTLGLFGLRKSYDVVILSASRYDVGITPLMNRRMVFVRSRDEAHPSDSRTLTHLETKDGYVLTSAFYGEDQENMSELEKWVFEVVITRKISDIAALLLKMNSFNMLTEDEQFYHIPIYLHLIDVAIATLTNSVR